MSAAIAQHEGFRVTDNNQDERTAMTVWPSLAIYPLGRALGRLYAIRAGFYIFTLGNLGCLAGIPLALAMYFWRVSPWGQRYTLTSRRVLIQRGLTTNEAAAVALDAFDRIEVEVLPGQAWYRAGDLVFFQGDTPQFRLGGVSRPEVFREVCLKTRAAVVGVDDVLRQTAESAA